MLNEQERELRKTQVGASDVAKLFNFNNKTLQDLYAEKKGAVKEDFTNQSMTAGNILEQICLEYFAKEHDIKNMELNLRVEHPFIPNFVSSTDGLEDESIPIENKTIGYDKLIELTKPLREHYIQVQAQISCTISKKAYIVYNGVTEYDLLYPLEYEPSDFKQKVFEIERDDELITEIEERVRYFLWCMEYDWKPSENEFQKQRLIKVMEDNK